MCTESYTFNAQPEIQLNISENLAATREELVKIEWIIWLVFANSNPIPYMKSQILQRKKVITFTENVSLLYESQYFIYA